MQLTKGGGYRPIESRDGKFVYFERGFGHFEVVRIAAGGGEETVLFKDPRSRWTLAGKGCYVFSQDESRDRWVIKEFDFATKDTTVVAELPGSPMIGQRPSVSPDGRSILYTQLDSSDADLMLLENFH